MNLVTCWGLVILSSVANIVVFKHLIKKKTTRRLSFMIGNLIAAGFLAGILSTELIAGPKICPAFGFLINGCWNVVGLSIVAMTHEWMRELGMYFTKMPLICNWEVGLLMSTLEFWVMTFDHDKKECVWQNIGVNKVVPTGYEFGKLFFQIFLAWIVLRRTWKKQRAELRRYLSIYRYKRDHILEDNERKNTAQRSLKIGSYVFFVAWSLRGILVFLVRSSLNFESDDYDFWENVRGVFSHLLLILIPLSVLVVEKHFKELRDFERLRLAMISNRSPIHLDGRRNVAQPRRWRSCPELLVLCKGRRDNDVSTRL